VFRKPRPKALDKRDRKREEAQVYRMERAKAIDRDGNKCRICNNTRYLETHHVERRSRYGPKQMLQKHDASNLLTVCGPSWNTESCHAMLTGNIYRAEAIDPILGTNGIVRIEKYSEVEQGYVTLKLTPAA
jgi:hypothetical protein